MCHVPATADGRHARQTTEGGRGCASPDEHRVCTCRGGRDYADAANDRHPTTSGAVRAAVVRWCQPAASAAGRGGFADRFLRAQHVLQHDQRGPRQVERRGSAHAARPGREA
eukprot:2965193-Prymnesium_polylepis.1